MFVVYFFEDKDLLLSQLRKTVPVVGEKVTIKGRKGIVSSAENIDEKKIYVKVRLEKTENKKLTVIENQKKKKR